MNLTVTTDEWTGPDDEFASEGPSEAADSESSEDDSSHEANRGRVALIATPIGNLADLTLRALERLRHSDVICCEDTRHSLRLLQRYAVGRKTLVSLHDRNEDRRIDEIISRARAGEAIAVLSDAGMPTVSDPGFRLVRACIEAGVPVDVLPGPSAVLTALAGSGLPTDAFYFGGFLPPKSGRRETEMREALDRTCTSIYFESPHRIARTLRVIATLSPDRPVCVARELTKKFETYHRGNAADLATQFENSPRKGEMTLVISGKPRRRSSE
ncbi:MAG: 16S rRNA (cytidine(1402)-2'-O)-methyltransferase [Verrucomicrobiae bacterium]|nr:16S rRNA (cytidine(1402)-2'-O)-methyltransferase [Verrucomicrobiae bacterium]